MTYCSYYNVKNSNKKNLRLPKIVLPICKKKKPNVDTQFLKYKIEVKVTFFFNNYISKVCIYTNYYV